MLSFCREVGKGEYSSCLYYDRNWTALVAAGLTGEDLPRLPTSGVPTRECKDWVYDHSTYESTAVEEVFTTTTHTGKGRRGKEDQLRFDVILWDHQIMLPWIKICSSFDFFSVNLRCISCGAYLLRGRTQNRSLTLRVIIMLLLLLRHFFCTL